jgi:hypothetical protein
MAEFDEKKAHEDPDFPSAVGDPAVLASKKEFIQSFFKRAGEFTEGLLRENERLRFRILELETEIGQRQPQNDANLSAAAFRELVARIEDLERERERMLTRFRSVEAENQDFERRYKDIERENNSLANLYVASFQLHSTLDLREVTHIILEILLNFVGAKTFAILLLDDRRGTLRPLAAEGIDRKQVPEVKSGEGLIGRVVTTGKAEYGGATHGPVDLQRPAFVTPLLIKERVVGAIVVWDLLPQKPGLEYVDHELFNLLAAHAATAILGAKLATEARDHAPLLAGAVDLV